MQRLRDVVRRVVQGPRGNQSHVDDTKGLSIYIYNIYKYKAVFVHMVWLSNCECRRRKPSGTRSLQTQGLPLVARHIGTAEVGSPPPKAGMAVAGLLQLNVVFV